MSEFIILGAGMIGVSAALELQAQGHDVTLVDRSAPGLETSYGNAGIIQTEMAEPYPLPRDAATLLAYALGQKNDVTYDLPGLVRMAPALWAYFRSSAPDRHRRISRFYAQLTARATDDHAAWIEAADAQSLIRRDGYYQAYRDPVAFDEAVQKAKRFRDDYGVPSTLLDGAELAAKEPALRKRVAGAVHWHDSWTCRDPGALTAAYAQLFQTRGGCLLTGDAVTLLPMPHEGWRVLTNAGPIEAPQCVVALGPWSPRLLSRLGYRIPMVLKRGYHGHFDAPAPLSRPLMDVANGVLLCPMQQGLRMATGAALVAPDAPPRPRQLSRGVDAVADLIALGPRIKEPQWYGTRPCMPDMLPLIGRAPNHQNLWFNFGHGHQGFTLGPTSAKLLAQAIRGERSELLSALDPTRPGAVRN